MGDSSNVSYPKNVSELLLNARNALNNLENWDYDLVGQYKMDKKEAEKLILVLKDYILSCEEASFDG